MLASLPLGRERELALLEEHLRSVGEGGSAVLVRGEVGAGKSAVLEATCHAALDLGLTVLTTAGFQSEARVAFAGLHRSLRPVLSGADGLPSRQRAAIQSAFGVHEAAEPDFFRSPSPRSTCCPRQRRRHPFCSSSKTQNGSIRQPATF